MKKAIALILSSAMLATGVAGLATACSKKGPTGDQPAKNFKRLVDPRDAGAFEVYSADGVKVGAYPSIADAINAAVYNDLDEFEVADVPDGLRGSYVTKKGSTRKIFENMTSYKAGTGDNFWYYNNNGLAGLEYYPMSGAPYNRAQNTKDIVYSVTDGITTNTEVSSYGVIDGLGQPIETGTFSLSSRAWELTPVTDASIKGIPVRDSGATGARYELDLTDVKIKPAYQGVQDDIYAFFGYTIGAGDYSLEIGVACNVNTGIWRQYISHNPYNNDYREVTVEYNVGKVLFTSTWNEQGGYYTPNVDTVELEVMEVKDENDNADDWWYDLVTIKADEKEILKVVVDDEYITQYGGGKAFDTKNGFYFVAGLDVVAAGAKLGDSNKAMDYTNGATFENLVVTKGEIYFHSDEEFDDTDYGAETDPALKGQWWNIHQPFEGSHDKGIYNYTILQLNACVDYELVGNTDVYSFRYDNYQSESEYSGLLKTYQDQIDELYDITEDTAGEYKDKIAAVEDLYKEGIAASSAVPEYCYIVLDWEALMYAREVFKNAVTFTEAGEALYAEFEKLTNILVLNEDWKGWSTTETGDAEYGYLLNELNLFRVMYRKLTNLEGGLTEDDQTAFERLVGDKWNTWANLMNGYDDLQAASFANTEFTIPNTTLTGNLTVLGKDLFGEYFKLVVEAYANKDDAVKCSSGPGGTLCAEEEWHFNISFRVLYIEWVLEKQLKEEGISLDYEAELMDMIRDYQTGGDMYLDFRYLAEVLTQIGRIIKGECTYLDAEIVAVINEYMVSDKYIKSTGNNTSNFNKGTSAYSFGNGNDIKWWKPYKGYFGVPESDASRNLRDLLQNELYEKILKGNTDATFINVHYQGNDKGQIGLKLNKAVSIPGELGPEAAAWLEQWKATTLTDLSDLTAWKGWKATGSDKAGYLADEIELFGTLYNAYLPLSTSDKLLLAEEIDQDVWTAWSTLYTDYTKATTGSFKDENITVAGTSYTGVQIIEELFKAIYSISDQKFSVGGFTDSFRVLYLNEVLKANFVEINYVDELIAILSADSGADVVYDFNYLYHVLGQVARVQKGELTKLDYALATVVNDYMYQVEALRSGVEADTIFTVAQNYFGIAKGEATELKDLVALLGDLIKQGKVQLNASGLGVDAKIADEDIPSQDTFTRQEVINAYDNANLSGLTNLDAWYGWKSATADAQTYANGYLYDELQKFGAVYAMYEKLSLEDQQQVVAHATSAVWEPWVELLTEYKTLAEDSQEISVWNQLFTEQPNMKKVDVFGAYIDGAYWAKKAGKIDVNQGYFMMDNQDTTVNAVYTFYLYEVLQGVNEIKYTETVWNMLAADSRHGVMADFEYIWNMGQQVARILDGTCTYLDAELAAAVNKYMHVSSVPTNNSFRNGTWTFYYRSSWTHGQIKNRNDGGDLWQPWMKAIDPALHELTTSENWYLAQQKINKLLIDANYEGNLLTVQNVTGSNTSTYGNAIPLYINCEVKALDKDPNDKDLGSVDGIAEEFNKLSDLTNYAPTNWKGGSSGSSDGLQYHYVLDEIQIFETIQNAAKAISKEDEVKAKVGSDKYEKWATLLSEYNTLKADTENKYDIVNGNATSIGGSVNVNGLAIVNGFFNALAASYDDEHDCAAFNDGTAKFGYLGTETEAGINMSMRALYLHNLIVTTDTINFPFADEFLKGAAAYGNGETTIDRHESKYVGIKNITETQCVIEDFNYFMTMTAQIKRIMAMDTVPQSMDAELQGIIDGYIETRFIKGMRTNKPDDYAVSNVLFSLGLGVAYRDNKNGFEKGDWTLYLGLDGTKTMSALFATYITPVVAGTEGYEAITPGSGSSSAATMFKKS